MRERTNHRGPAVRAAGSSKAARPASGSARWLSGDRGQARDADGALGLDAREFERRLAELQRRYEGAKDGQGSYGCVRCVDCTACMFCIDCEECYRCTHCRSCTRCTASTHCIDCRGCHESSYCRSSESCSGSSFLTLCRECTECTYCFGCVGLHNKEFYILNERYDRQTYFEIVARLERELGLS